MKKPLYFLWLVLIVLACSFVFFACKLEFKEIIVEDYKNVFEITVGDDTLLFHSWYNEDMIYTYQLHDDDEKSNETYEVRNGEDWYLYEENSFGYWTRSLTDNPYDDELDIQQDDFYLDSDNYYALRSEKLEKYSDMFSDFEDVDISSMRVKFDDNQLPVEMLISIYFSDVDTYANGKMTFEYNTGETFVPPEQFVPSYNIKISSSSTYSPHVYNSWVFENVAYTFFADSNSGLGDGYWLEIDAYGTWVGAHWNNNSWQYSDRSVPQSTGFNMIKAMDLIDFDDFVEEGESLVLTSSKLKDYAPFILPSANPDTVVLSDFRIKVANGEIIEMIYSSYFEDEYERTETITRTLTFEYDVLTVEDLP